MKYQCFETGFPKKIQFNDMIVPFRAERGLSLLIVKEGEEIEVPLDFTESDHGLGQWKDICFSLSYHAKNECFGIDIVVENRGVENFCPDHLDIRLGVDTYMEHYPEWNSCFFPTFLRCEKQHFYGYLMTPMGKMLGIGCCESIAAYHLEYNRWRTDWGHRIEGVRLHLLHDGSLPDHHPKDLTCLKSGECLKREILLFPINTPDTFEEQCSLMLDAPILSANRYTVSKGERIQAIVSCQTDYQISLVHPDGTLLNDVLETEADQYGEYGFQVISKNGKTANLRVLCHRPWRDYLVGAREASLAYPQKATTHAESWYGFYSAFLAAKHFPKPELDRAMVDHFLEIMPMMFDFEACVPLVIPNRIQNTATLIGVLTDLFESDPKQFGWALDKAALFAEFLISKQSEDGAYRCGKGHYTCVIYIAKSMLELSIAEMRQGRVFIARRHYQSAKLAIDELVEHLEEIGTEGEHTLEDGMISCSALQIAMFALTLPEGKRAPYIYGAEKMLERHRCLENTRVPDYRMNGGSLRFWEGQYDVMLMHNCMNSPHGWTAWTIYATYYLYLLTGKRSYLIQTYNAMGACASLLKEDGKLSWAFLVDPAITAQALVSDKVLITDAYRNVPNTQGFRGKWETVTVGECYYPMISNWYRTTAEQPITGGYSHCLLIYGNHRKEEVDPQGGACDNDVHEVFKCLEETLMDKAFLLDGENGIETVGGATLVDQCGMLLLTIREDVRFLHCNLKQDVTISVRGKIVNFPEGRYFWNLEENGVMENEYQIDFE